MWVYSKENKQPKTNVSFGRLFDIPMLEETIISNSIDITMLGKKDICGKNRPLSS